jgi:hypothetical protein
MAGCSRRARDVAGPGWRRPLLRAWFMYRRSADPNRRSELAPPAQNAARASSRDSTCLPASLNGDATSVPERPAPLHFQTRKAPVIRRHVNALTLGFLLAVGLVVHGQQPTPAAPAEPVVGMFRPFAPGLLTRVSYTAPTTGRYRVAIWDLLVGPGKACDAVKLPGGAVIEVRSGRGHATIDGQARALTGGATFVVNEGSSFALSNRRDDLALALRATLISWGGP